MQHHDFRQVQHDTLLLRLYVEKQIAVRLSGDDFLTPQAAIEFAQATAQVLTNSLSGDWVGWSIEVRNAEGKRILFIAGQ